MAHIYVKDRTGNDWSRHGRMVEDIGYFAEILRLLFSANKAPSNLPDIFPIGLIEYVVFDTVGLRQEMAYSVDAILVRKSVRLGEEYCVFKGILPDKTDVDCQSLKDYFIGDDYVRAVERINNMENEDRSGDLVLLMKNRTSDDAIDRYTAGVSCKSWHGSLNTSDSYVPLIVSYPGGNKNEIEPFVNDTEGCDVTDGCDGNWRVTDLIKKIIGSEYGTQ